MLYYLVDMHIVWVPEVGRKEILPVAKYSHYGIIPSVHSGTMEITPGDNHWTHFEKDLS